MNQKTIQKSDYITNRVLTFFGATAALLWAISFLHRGFNYHSSYRTAQNISLALVALGLAGAVYGVMRYLRQTRDGSIGTATVTGTIVLWFSLVLACGAGMMRFYDYTFTMRMLYIVMPVSAILYLIFCTYPREFFTVATTHAGIAVLLFLIAQASELPERPVLKLAALVAGLAVCAVPAGFFLAAQKHGGMLPVGILRLRLFSPQVGRGYPAAVYGATAALLVAAFLLGAPFAYYAMFAVLGFLFALVVYYTVRMF